MSKIALRAVAALGALALLAEQAYESFPLAERQLAQLWISLGIAAGCAAYVACSRKARAVWTWDLLVPPAILWIALRMLPYLFLLFPTVWIENPLFELELVRLSLAITGASIFVIVLTVLFSAWEIVAILAVVRGVPNPLGHGLRHACRVSPHALIGLLVGAVVGVLLVAGAAVLMDEVASTALRIGVPCAVAWAWNCVTAPLLLRMADPQRETRRGLFGALAEGMRRSRRWLIPTACLMLLMGALTYWSADFTIVEEGDERIDTSSYGVLERHELVFPSMSVTHTKRTKWGAHFKWTGGFESESSWFEDQADLNEVSVVPIFSGMSSWFVLLAMLVFKLQVALALTAGGSSDPTDDVGSAPGSPSRPAGRVGLLLLVTLFVPACGDARDERVDAFERVHQVFHEVDDGRFHIRPVGTYGHDAEKLVAVWPAHMRFPVSAWRTPGMKSEARFEIRTSRACRVVLECRARGPLNEEGRQVGRDDVGRIRFELSSGGPCFLHLGLVTADRGSSPTDLVIQVVGAMRAPAAEGSFRAADVMSLSETVSAHPFLVRLLPEDAERTSVRPALVPHLLGTWNQWLSGESGAAFPVIWGLDMGPYTQGGYRGSMGRGGYTLIGKRAKIVCETGWPTLVVDGETLENPSRWPAHVWFLRMQVTEIDS